MSTISSTVADQWMAVTRPAHTGSVRDIKAFHPPASLAQHSPFQPTPTLCEPAPGLFLQAGWRVDPPGDVSSA